MSREPATNTGVYVAVILAAAAVGFIGGIVIFLLLVGAK